MRAQSLIHLLLLFLPLVTGTAPRLPRRCRISVIGAGIGGVYSAWRLTVDEKNNPVRASDVCVFEAKHRPGGRILTVNDPAPGFDGYTVDLGAYRFHRSSHQLMRSLAEDALGIQTLCYTDPLDRADQCVGNIRRIVSFRGKVIGIKKNGDGADEALAVYGPHLPYMVNKRYQWGPGKKLESQRDPYDVVFSPNSVVKEIADRYNELEAEKDYATAMTIADEIIAAMSMGKYRGMRYSEVSVLQAAIAEGFTTEELQLLFDSGFADNFFLRHSLEHLGQLLLRELALEKKNVGLKALVTPVKLMDGVPRRIGMVTIIEEMLKQIEAKGVKVFYGAKVTSVKRSKPGSRVLDLTFSDGSSVRSESLLMNIGKPDLIALGLESEPMKSSKEPFRRAVERNFVTGASKTYCFWEDAWWLTKLEEYVGRVRTAEENLQSMRYHDGHVTCKNKTEMTGCRGGLLTSYSFGDSSGLGMAIHVHSHNAFPYTPLTNTDNVHRLVPGEMNGIEKLYFDGLMQQIRRTHKSSFKTKKLDVDKDIPDAVGCVVADWRDVGVHTEMGPGKGGLNIYELFTNPSKDLDISLVNEAWGQDQGWAEGSLRSAEKALFHRYGLSKPGWLDAPFHNSVIKKFNQG